MLVSQRFELRERRSRRRGEVGHIVRCAAHLKLLGRQIKVRPVIECSQQRSRRSRSIVRGEEKDDSDERERELLNMPLEYERTFTNVLIGGIRRVHTLLSVRVRRVYVCDYVCGYKT